MFDKALKDLIAWWYTNWRITSAKGIERRLVRDVQKELKALGYVPLKDRIVEPEPGAVKKDLKGKGKEKVLPPSAPETYDLDSYYLQDIKESGDYIRHFGALEKRAIEMRGSRDISVLLFTCLCRALDIGARLVFSLQPVDWRAPSTVSGGARKSKAKPMVKEINSERMEESSGGSRRGSAVASTSKATDTSRNASEDEVSKDYRPKLRKSKTKKTVKALPMGTLERSPSPGMFSPLNDITKLIRNI